jgi:parallel beta-helix repeat protein
MYMETLECKRVYDYKEKYETIKRKNYGSSPLIVLVCVILVVSISCSYFEENTEAKKKNNYKISSSYKFHPSSNSKVISLYNVNNKIISGMEIEGGNMPAITLKNCTNIRITGNTLSNSTDVGIYLYQCKNIIVNDNYISDVSTGVYVQQSNGGGIVIINNQFLNMHGPLPRGQFVQLNRVNGPKCLIANNKCENMPGASDAEDAINLYKSNGTAESPIIVRGNYIRGGGPSKTGGGIALGDAGGSHQLVENNVLVNPGQYGIGVAGGTDMRILNNKIYAKRDTFTNVGISVWNQYTDISGCNLITVLGNNVNWTNSKGISNPGWDSGNCGTVEGWERNNWTSAITHTVLPAVLIKKPLIRHRRQ